jgi:hypothetical protein
VVDNANAKAEPKITENKNAFVAEIPTILA